MEPTPQRANGDSDYFVPIESIGEDWPTDDKVHLSDVPKPDQDILKSISVAMEAEGMDLASDLPKALLKYAIVLTRPKIDKLEKIQSDLDDAFSHVKNIISPLSAQEIFNFITQKGSADVPTFYALHEVINDYQRFLVDSNDVEELIKMEEIRKTAYWMSLYLMTLQTRKKSPNDLLDQIV